MRRKIFWQIVQYSCFTSYQWKTLVQDGENSLGRQKKFSILPWRSEDRFFEFSFIDQFLLPYFFKNNLQVVWENRKEINAFSNECDRKNIWTIFFLYLSERKQKIETSILKMAADEIFASIPSRKNWRNLFFSICLLLFGPHNRCSGEYIIIKHFTNSCLCWVIVTIY